MTTGLSTKRVINVSWSLSSAAASYENIDTCLILGDSDVIDTHERMRSYDDLPDVAGDFSATDPEYLAAQIFFAQTPTPESLFIGRWARTATAGQLVGAILSSSQQALANFTAVTAGAFKVAVNGAATPTTISGLNFASAASLSAVASIITTALASAAVGATCTWDGERFRFKTSATGSASAVSFLTAPASGTDISGLLGGLSTSGGYSVQGVAAETPLAAVELFDDLPKYFWGLTFAASTQPATADYVAVAGYIEDTAHTFAITTQDTAALDAAATTDVGYLIQQLGYERTFGIYSSSSPYAAAGIFGDILTTDFDGSNTMPTEMYKVIIGVTAESLKTSQADALDGKRYSYFAVFDNEASIVVNGTCFGDAYIDEIFGCDWLANRIQTDLFNLETSVKKVPQTDTGMTLIQTKLASSLDVGVTNGLIGENLTWQGDGFGSLKTGDVLPSGFYIYIPKISSQSAADRKTRVSPPIQVAINLAGAVHKPNISLVINR